MTISARERREINELIAEAQAATAAGDLGICEACGRETGLNENFSCAECTNLALIEEDVYG